MEAATRKIVLTCILGAACWARAADKDRCTLLDPTPPDLMRELNTDRPDVTESPYTIDAGHVQLESSFIEYARDKSERDLSELYSVMPSNFRIGVLNKLEIDAIVQPYQHLHTGGQTFDGFGDLFLRAKLNLWGNDDGNTAFALLPFVILPTAQDNLGPHHVQGGIKFPLALKLPAEFELDMMAEVDFLRNAQDSDYETSFVHTLSL